MPYLSCFPKPPAPVATRGVDDQQCSRRTSLCVMLLLTATSAAPNSMGRAVPERQVLLPKSTALRQESSPTYAAKLAKPCVSLVPNVRDGWCERNCRVDNCPSGVCSCDGSTTSASVVKAPTGHPFAAVSKNASAATSARSFTVAQLPEESIGFCEPAPS